MNLAPVSVEHSHGDCAGGPGQVGDKFERAHAASRVGAQFSNDIRRTVKILDSVLHFRDPRAQASWSMDRWLPSCCAAHCRERAPRPVLIGGRRGDKNCGPPAVRGRYASPFPQVLASKLVFEDGLASRSLDNSAYGQWRSAATLGNYSSDGCGYELMTEHWRPYTSDRQRIADRRKRRKGAPPPSSTAKRPSSPRFH